MKALPLPQSAPEPEVAPNALLVTLTVGQLEAACERAASRAIAAQVPAPEYLTRQRLAGALDVSLATVDKLTREGLPHVTVGDSKRYRLADVHAHLATKADG